MVEILTENKRVLEINAPETEAAFHANRVFLAALKGAEIDINDLFKQFSSFRDSKEGLAALGDVDIDFNGIVGAALTLLSSRELDEAFLACLSRSKYNKEKITIRTFDDETARSDYYEIIAHCAKATLTPFLKGLLSVWKVFTVAEEKPQK